MRNRFGILATACLCVTLLSFVSASSLDTPDQCTPRAIRLMLGERYAAPFSSPYTATVSYQTYGECDESGVVFTQNQLEIQVGVPVHSTWNDRFCHNKKKNCEQVVYDQYIHTIRIAAEPQKPFSYKLCSDTAALSDCTEVYTSTMPIPSGTNTSTQSPMKILFFGDHDNSEAGMVTFNSLYKTLDKETFDAFLFLGDYGYEFYQDNGKVGDTYIENLTPINTAAPMAITAGNHEDNFNFEFFNQKFQMMSFNETKNNYYSFEIGKVHILSLNLHYYNDQVSTPNPQNQADMLAWVEKDLKSIDRTRTPWVIAFGHKMIYCKGSDCDDFASDYAPFDVLLNQYGLDLFISGHKHKFQVMKPIKKSKPQGFLLSESNVMSDFKGFPTVIQGNGGTSKADDDVDPTDSSSSSASFVKAMLTKSKDTDTSGLLFTKSVQKTSMLYEVYGLGYGKLTVEDDKTIRVDSYDSNSNQVVYTISFKK